MSCSSSICTPKGPHRRGDRRRRQHEWCAQIARNLTEAREGRTTPIRYLVHDRDKRFGEPSTRYSRAEGIEILRTPWRAPRANAYAERFIRTVRTECLDRDVRPRRTPPRSVLKTYVEHYNRERPHRGLDLRIPEGGPAAITGATGPIVRHDRSRWPNPRIPSEGRLRPFAGATTAVLTPRRSEFKGLSKRAPASLSRRDRPSPIWSEKL